MICASDTDMSGADSSASSSFSDSSFTPDFSSSISTDIGASTDFSSSVGQVDTSPPMDFSGQNAPSIDMTPNEPGVTFDPHTFDPRNDVIPELTPNYGIPTYQFPAGANVDTAQTVQIDPNTGQPVYNDSAFAGVDPNTGQPDYPNGAYLGVDPNTGQPIYNPVLIQQQMNNMTICTGCGSHFYNPLMTPNRFYSGQALSFCSQCQSMRSRRSVSPIVGVIIVGIFATVFLVIGAIILSMVGFVNNVFPRFP